MSVPHGQEPHASLPERQDNSYGLSAEERELFHELLHVLKGLASAKGLSGGDDAGISMKAEAGFDKSKDEKATVLQARNDQEAVGTEWRQGHNQTKIFVRFEKLCDDHGQLAYRIRTSLNALGGGGRTGKALQGMHEGIEGIRDLFATLPDMTIFRLTDVKRAFGNYKEAAVEAIDAFKELGVFNTNFFDVIERILRRLEAMTARFDVEYGGRFGSCLVDMYLDSLFEPLIDDFECFLKELTNIAEKEISAIRQSQNFTSQRYLNLTTVATFLSSVTATTLQTTADDSDSPLWSAINTLWFISLDFSMASAVYSLLVMTWRQSSVCKPDLSLPSTLKTWLLNGPMYTLIASVLTFSIGLSLFAYRALRQQVGLASAVVPTTLAAILASSIFLFSAWFLFEQWKARDGERWDMVRIRYIILARSVPGRTLTAAKNCGRWVIRCVKRTTAVFKAAPLSAIGRRKSDIEAGQHTILAPVQVPSEESQKAPPAEVRVADNISNPQSEIANLETTLATPDMTPTAQQGDSETNEEVDNESPVEEVEYKPFQDVLRFSPAGRFLASAHSDTVVVYDVLNSFSIFGSIQDPDAAQIRQIEWNPEYNFQTPDGEVLIERLLVRSSKGVSIWGMQYFPADIYMVGHLTDVTGPVHWIGLHDSGTIGFVTSAECTIRVFDRHCKEVPNRSVDVSKIPKMPEMPEMPKVKEIMDAIFYQSKYIFCLAQVAESDVDIFLVINLHAKKIERHQSIHGGHKRMILSPAAKAVLFIGNKYGVDVAELSILSSESGLKLGQPENAVTFHGYDDSMIIGYSSGVIIALHKPKRNFDFEPLHIFSTRVEEAIPKNPASFSVSPWGWSGLYLFAFADEHGSVTVWSVQSNQDLSNCKSAKVFAAEDRRDGHWVEPVILPGRYLVLPPPIIHDSAGQSSREAR